MAATLIHIKSRMLLPRPDPTQEDPEEDPREALVRRLLEHQKFKAAAELLFERATVRGAQWMRPDKRVAGLAGDEDRKESSKLICSACCRPSSTCSSGRKSGPRCRSRSSRSRWKRASSNFWPDCRTSKPAGSTISLPTSLSRGDMIVTFLALLEMIRLKLVRVFQASPFGPIHISHRARPADAPHPIGDVIILKKEDRRQNGRNRCSHSGSYILYSEFCILSSTF